MRTTRRVRERERGSRHNPRVVVIERAFKNPMSTAPCCVREPTESATTTHHTRSQMAKNKRSTTGPPRRATE